MAIALPDVLTGVPVARYDRDAGSFFRPPAGYNKGRKGSSCNSLTFARLAADT